MKSLITVVCLMLIGCAGLSDDQPYQDVSGIYMVIEGSLKAKFGYEAIDEKYTAEDYILLNLLQSDGAILFHTCIGVLAGDTMKCDLDVPSPGGCMTSKCKLEFNNFKLTASIHFEVVEYSTIVGSGDYKLELEKWQEVCDAGPIILQTLDAEEFDAWRIK